MWADLWGACAERPTVDDGQVSSFCATLSIGRVATGCAPACGELAISPSHQIQDLATHMIDSPIFLVGAERSGTTLLRLMLDSHPDITGCEGFEFIVDLMGDDGSYPEMQRYWDYLSAHNIFGSANLTVDRSLDYPSLVNSFLQQRLDLSGKDQVSAMVHFHFARLLELWPNARFIHVLRDPRDVTSSVLQMGWQGNVWFGLDKWILAEEEWDRLVPKLRSEQHIEIPYADLIGDHETQLRRITEFLSVPYTQQMLDYANDTDYGVPDPSKVAQWHKKLSDREIGLVEGRVGDLMQSRGFELSGLPVIKPGKTEMLTLQADNRMKQWKKRIDKFGLRLFVERGLSRVLPIPGYQKSVKLRFNEIERANRKRSWREPGREYSVKN